MLKAKLHVSSRFTTCFLVRPPYLLPKGRLFDLLDLLKAWLQLRSINLTEFVSFVEMIRVGSTLVVSLTVRSCKRLQLLTILIAADTKKNERCYGEEP